MFDDIPDNYKRPDRGQSEEEGWRYTQGDKNARRPPELLTRDHVARCIMREVKAGRGSPHGGVFLDISWIKEKLPNAAEHIKKKLPSMYHQFMQLAEHRHHQGADGSRPDHPLHHGRHPRGRRHADVQRARAFSPRANAPRACNGANRLGGNSLSDLLVFGKRAGEFAAKYAKENPPGNDQHARVEEAARRSAGAV